MSKHTIKAQRTMTLYLIANDEYTISYNPNDVVDVFNCMDGTITLMPDGKRDVTDGADIVGNTAIKLPGETACNGIRLQSGILQLESSESGEIVIVRN